MRCPNCGTENTDNHKFCYECAHPLIAEAAEFSDFEDSDKSDALNIQESKIENDETNMPDVQETEIENIEETEGVSDFDDTQSTEKSSEDIIKNLFDNPNDDEESYQDSDDEDYDYDDYDDEYEEEQKQSRRKKVKMSKDKRSKEAGVERSGNMPFVFVTFVLIILIAALFYAYLKKEYDGSLSLLVANVFGTNPITASATIKEDLTNDGEPALLITIYAKKGYIVSFEEGATQKEAVVTGHYVSFRVPQSLWIPHDASESNEISVTPTVFVKDPNTNIITQVDFMPFIIQIPSVTITIVLPETLTYVTSSSTVEIAGYVSDITASVFMGGTQLQTDENGYFRGIYHIDKLGVSNVVIEAHKAGHAVGSAIINITYTKSEINLSITNETMRTFTDTIEIQGTIDQGALLSVSGVEIDGDIDINEDGTFSFIAKVPNVGLYTPKLTVSYGDVTSSIDIYIEHAPNLDEYIQSAWALDYEWMLQHPTMARHFGFSCKVIEVLQSEPFVIAKVRTDNGDLIVYYYHTTLVEANDGKNYRMYAFLDGKDLETGLPIMYCWFIYKS